MINTGFRLPSWVPPVIMSIPPVALLYATHLIVIIAGDRLDKINTAIDTTRVPEAAPRETRVPVEPVKAQPVQPAPVPMPTPVAETKPAAETEPMIPDLFDFQTIVPDMEDDADPKPKRLKPPVAAPPLRPSRPPTPRSTAGDGIPPLPFQPWSRPPRSPRTFQRNHAGTGSGTSRGHYSIGDAGHSRGNGRGKGADGRSD